MHGYTGSMRRTKRIILTQILSLCITSLVVTNVRALDRLSISATQLGPFKPAAHRFEFTPEEELTSAAMIDIVYPDHFILSHAIMAASGTMPGGLTLSVHGDTVRVKRSGLGPSIPAGRTCDLIIATVINPRKADGDLKFTVIIRQENGLSMERAAVTRIALFRQ